MSPHRHPSRIWLQASAQLLYLLSYSIMFSFLCNRRIYSAQLFGASLVQGGQLAFYSKEV